MGSGALASGDTAGQPMMCEGQRCLGGAQGSAVPDQSRVATPQAALAGGADLLVIGRPITAAPDPQAAARLLAQSLALR